MEENKRKKLKSADEKGKKKGEKLGLQEQCREETEGIKKKGNKNSLKEKDKNTKGRGRKMQYTSLTRGDEMTATKRNN